MTPAIESRELITVAVGDARLRGTHHRVPAAASGAVPPRSAPSRLGIVFLNPGYLPRAARGDAATYWADALARVGYPSFRFDLPGLGDSSGDLPREVPQFVDLVNAGTFAPLVYGIVKHVVQHFDLSGAVVVGHCAGAVSALYAASVNGNKDMRGLILLDPYFQLEETVKTPTTSRWPARVRRGLQDAWLNRLAALRLWALTSSVGAAIQTIYQRRRSIPLLCRDKTPSGNVNRRLVRSWEHLVAIGLPMLVIKALPPKDRREESDYLRYLEPANGRGHVAFHRIEGTSHAFVEGDGKNTVRECIERWLHTSFPHVSAELLSSRAATSALSLSYQRNGSR